MKPIFIAGIIGIAALGGLFLLSGQNAGITGVGGAYQPTEQRGYEGGGLDDILSNLPKENVVFPQQQPYIDPFTRLMQVPTGYSSTDPLGLRGTPKAENFSLITGGETKKASQIPVAGEVRSGVSSSLSLAGILAGIMSGPAGAPLVGTISTIVKAPATDIITQMLTGESKKSETIATSGSGGFGETGIVYSAPSSSGSSGMSGAQIRASLGIDTSKKSNVTAPSAVSSYTAPKSAPFASAVGGR